jgi:gliding motility-associated-like protein
MALVTGGQEPYDYLWSTGVTEAEINNLAAGIYTLILTDNLGCVMTQNFELTAPEPIEATVVFSNPTCEGLTTGEIEIVSVTGGIMPYSYAVNNGAFSDQLIYPQLSPGENEVIIMDANQCIYRESQELVPPQIPVISGESSYDLLLGCEVQVQNTLNDINVASITWLDTSYLDCINCLDPLATPLETQDNMLIVTSEDGCIDSFFVSFQVETLREFYVPNIFSPDGNGINDTFCVFGGKEVQSVDLMIYDRWGELIFESQEIPADDCSAGWDGRFKNEDLNPGVYVWKANVLFIDSISESFSGDVTLVR